MDKLEETTEKKKASKVIGPYRLLKKLDAGGMGIVFKAVRKGTSNELALKALPPKFAKDPERLARFRREVLACSRLNHPNLIRVYDHGVDRGVPYFAMEYFPGISLKKLIRKDGALSPEKVISIGRQVAAACAYYHQKHLVHRDIKPANILIDQAGRVKIIDFGLAKVHDLSSMTRIDQALGTARYLAPEILMGRPVDRRTDLYQVGLVLHELLTGEPVFAGQEPMTLVRNYIFHNTPLEDANFKVTDKSWATLLRNCLAVIPEDRYDNATELAVDLDRIARGEDIVAIDAQRSKTEKNNPDDKEAAPSRKEVKPPKTSGKRQRRNIRTLKFNGPLQGKPGTARREKTLKMQAAPEERPESTIQRTFFNLLKIIPPILIVIACVSIAFLFKTRPLHVFEVKITTGIEQATVTWKTSRPCASSLEYSLAGKDSFQVIESATPGIEHKVSITRLEPGTSYRLRFILGPNKRSNEWPFKTGSPAVRFVDITERSKGQFVINFKTSVALVCELEYPTKTGTSRIILSSRPQSAHSAALPGYYPQNNRPLKLHYSLTSEGKRSMIVIPAPQRTKVR